jgi:hypothetical protein
MIAFAGLCWWFLFIRAIRFMAFNRRGSQTHPDLYGFQFLNRDNKTAMINATTHTPQTAAPTRRFRFSPVEHSLYGFL